MKQFNKDYGKITNTNLSILAKFLRGYVAIWNLGLRCFVMCWLCQYQIFSTP